MDQYLPPDVRGNPSFDLFVDSQSRWLVVLVKLLPLVVIGRSAAEAAFAPSNYIVWGE